jgi:hypothetical protein
MKTIACIAYLILLPIAAVQAQTSPAAPPAIDPAKSPVAITAEPHHHLILENDYVRVFRVEIISPDATLLHRHDLPYAYMSIGKAEFTNAVEGKPDIRISMADGQLGYSNGGFSHLIRTENDLPFYNITIELRHPQGAAHSDCSKVVNGPLQGCSASQTAVADTERKNDEETKKANGTSAGTGSSAPVTQLAPDNAQKTPAGPPAFTSIIETDESTLKSATFPTKARSTIDAGPSGVLLVIAPLSQFKVDFSDGSSKLLSGGDPIWLQAGSKNTLINTSEQTSSTLLIFAFKDAPKEAAK